MRGRREEISTACIFKRNIDTSHPGDRNKANLLSLGGNDFSFIYFFFNLFFTGNIERNECNTGYSKLQGVECVYVLLHKTLISPFPLHGDSLPPLKD